MIEGGPVQQIAEMPLHGSFRDAELRSDLAVAVSHPRPRSF
jgi:hypothetical protein